MKRSFALVAVALGMVAAAACSSSNGPDLAGEGSSSGGTPTGGEDASTSSSSSGGSSSGGMDTGAPIDSGSDSPHDAGADARADLSCTGLAYCDDFESYTASTTPIASDKPVGPWTTSTSGDITMTIDTVRPYGGKNALHLKAPKGSTGASGLLNMVKTAGLISTDDLWGRAMVYYDKTAAAGTDLPNGVHSWIFQGIGTSTADGKIMSLNLANHGDYYFLNYHGDSKSTAETSKNGGTPVAAEWVCMTWEYNSSGTAPVDDAKVWADGVLALDATKAGENWNLATPFTTVQFGFTHYQTLANAIDVYIDDIALDKAAIPCPAK